jgi:acyl-CoA synthetase (AMP-forming)/AMP-acid ligase II
VSEILKIIGEHARRDAGRAAILHRESDGSYRATRYAELAEEAERFARAFARHAAGARIVPVLAAKSAMAIAALLGATASGCAAASLNPRLRGPQVEAILRAGRARIAVVDGPGLLALGPAREAGAPIRSTGWWLVRAPGFLPLHEKAAEALRATAQVENWPVASDPGDLRWPDPESPAACLFTSGSTGHPKGVLVSHRDLVERARAEIDCFGISERDVLLSVLPFSFDVGLNQLVTSLVAGCTLVILDSWMPADILRTVEERGVTGISAVPSIWLDFLKAGFAFDRADRHRTLRYVTVSGGDLPPDPLARLPALGAGLQIFKTYGQTEVFRPTCLLPGEFESRRTSVGRPFGRSRVYVVREDGARAAPGESGEVVATGLGVMLGYLDGSDEQRKLRDNPFRGPEDPSTKAVYTGDIGHLDASGYLYLHGRRDAMLKIQGNRVYPGEVAAQLLAVAGVLEAEVVGCKPASGNVELVAFVVLGPAAPQAADLRRLLATRLPAWMLPARVLEKDAIPRTASGKPDLPALAAEAAARSGQSP